MWSELMTASLKERPTNATEHSPSWEANGLSARQEIPHIWRTTKVTCGFLKSPTLNPTLSQTSLVHAFASYVRVF